MFEFKNKVDLRNKSTAIQPKVNYMVMDRVKEIEDWCNSEEHKRFNHLQTLIIKAYESIGIKLDTFAYGEMLTEEFTRDDYINDYAVFFKPEVFDKLKEWCKEYEILRKLESKVLYGVE